jgi:hypothetical protein
MGGSRFLVTFLVFLTPAFAAGSDFDRELDAFLIGDGDWGALKINSFCWDETGSNEVEIYGTGTAIWKSRAQFSLGNNQIREILGEIRQAGFTEWKGSYGGPAEAGTPHAVRVVCQVGVSFGSASKTVSQREKGDQFKPLTALSQRIFTICREPAGNSITADSLTDGLEKLASARLAPETFSLILHTRRMTGIRGQSPSGKILRINGLAVSLEVYTGTADRPEPVKKRLEPERLRELARSLKAGQLETLPINLYAEDYTDLSIQILDQEKSIQARQFANLTPAKHGQAQVSFNRMLEAVLGLSPK